MKNALGGLKQGELALLLRIVEKLSRSQDHYGLRQQVAEDLLRLLRADYFASYIWSPESGSFKQGVFFNMSSDNIERYESYYQFRDPITRKLQRFKRATLVTRVMPQKELEKTEFFNDFLMADGLHHGINVYAYDGGVNIGDLRIWRAVQRPEFGNREAALLDTILPHFRNALRNVKAIGAAGRTGDPREDMLESAPGALFVFNQEGLLVYRNKRAGEIEDRLSALEYGSFFESVGRAARMDLSRPFWGPFRMSALRGLSPPGSTPVIIVAAEESAEGGTVSGRLKEKYGLSTRESEICALVSKGLIDREIASILSIGFSTVRTHLKSIFRKVDVTNRTELVYMLMGEEAGW